MALEDDLKQLEQLLNDPKVRASNRATWNGKTYSLVDLIALRDETKRAIDEAVRTKTQEVGRQQAQQRAAEKTSAAKAKQIRGLEALVTTANGNLNIAIDRGGDVAGAQKNLSVAIENLRAVDPTNKLIPQESPAGRTVAPQRATAGMRGEGMGATPAEAPATPTTTPSTTQTVPTSAGTSKTTTPGKSTKVAKQGKVDTTADAWMEQFRKDYPAYSDWTTQSVIDYFGQDVVDVLMKTVDPNVEYSDEELLTLFKQTRYYNQTTGKQQEFDKARPAVQTQLLSDARRAIISEYADLNLAESDLVDLSRQVARSGLTGSGLKQAVYQYAFRRPSAGPGMTAPATAQAALQGADADEIRNSLRAYGYKVSDAELQAALTGGMFNGVAVSKDQLLQKAQRIAKVQYGALADAIDAGASVDDVFYNYKQYAAQTLGLDPSQIDYMRDPKWAEAFGTKETGPLSLSEWVTKLKSDSRFGWQYTADANKQAEDVAMSIARAFGKVQ